MQEHPPSAFDAVVIGAGVIGAATAFELGRRGRSVLCVDKLPAAGFGSSSRTREWPATAWPS